MELMEINEKQTIKNAKKKLREYRNSKYFLNETALHKQIKQILPKTFRAKGVTIKKGRRFFEDFSPKLVYNPWHFDAYTNGREHAENQKRDKKERGYERI